jgi:hypothetical protein
LKARRRALVVPRLILKKTQPLVVAERLADFSGAAFQREVNSLVGVTVCFGSAAMS